MLAHNHGLQPDQGPISCQWRHRAQESTMPSTTLQDHPTGVYGILGDGSKDKPPRDAAFLAIFGGPVGPHIAHSGPDGSAPNYSR
jgi:hypothetical protein